MNVYRICIDTYKLNVSYLPKDCASAIFPKLVCLNDYNNG